MNFESAPLSSTPPNENRPHLTLALSPPSGSGEGIARLRSRYSCALVIKFAFGIAVCSVAIAAQAAALPERVSFNHHIRPLLSDRCFACHGPDEKGRKAKLRLDTEEGAHKSLDAATGMQPFAPGSLEKSEAWRRIITTNADDQMPPPQSNLALNADEVALIRRWIEQGAEFQRHWAFIPVDQVPVPRATNGVVRNEIDAFVLNRLAREGLQPAPEATREVLLRRLSLDLTGLPPSIEELDAFLADTAPDAYARAVERLLSSPHYGERMAMDWLDLARYADTYGYQADVDRDMSPWRDWVIAAFNRNLPYSEFILWQIAGDLLPNATREQRLATAFNRLHRQTNEGGSIEEEFRAEYVADRVNTLSTAVLGLTMECSRCHDHKYDPIKQRDYYRLGAFFNSIDESGLYSHFTRATPTPTLLLFKDGDEARHQELQRNIAEQERRLGEVAGKKNTAFDQWLAAGGATNLVRPAPTVAYRFEEVTGNKTPREGTTNQPAVLHDAPLLTGGHRGQAMLFSGDNELVCAGAGAFNRTQPFSFSLWLKPAEAAERAVVFHRSRSWTDSGSRGYELLLEHGRPSFALIHFWPGNAVRVMAREPLPTNAWSHLVITYDGSSRAAGLKLFLNGRALATETGRDHLIKDITHRAEWGDADVGNIQLTLAGRFRDSGFKHGAIDDFEVFDRTLSAAEVRLVHAEQSGNAAAPAFTRDELRDYFLKRQDEAWQTAARDLQQAREAENKFINDVREIMVMEEMPQPRPAFLLKRGAYDAPGERVERGTPEGIMPLPAEFPRNRLGLAQWLTDRRQPLTARVAVNRIWRMHFGRGLVATQEDFGSQGRLPTHPELLDWLAGWFMDHGWDVKALHRLIVNSATYRQDSHASPALLARDPDNLLLARGPKHRLLAEQIRDSALAVSGLLNRQIGGPSVKPYQPAGLWEESGTGKTYTQDHGDKLYRRSLYTFWRRTAPPPAMLTFDATSREVCTAKRENTATPLQSLILLNDPQFIEAARVLGERLVRANPDSAEQRINTAFRLATSRAPTERERAVLRRLFNEQLAYFTANAGAAEKYLAIGESKRDASLPSAELAATAVVVSAAMNHDEFVMQR